ncbi:MAG: ferritin family protein [Anaerolineales bacterium]
MDAIEVLKTGMSTELWGMRFYEQAVARTADDTGKAVFRALVKEEQGHLDILRGQYAALTSGQGTVSLERAKELAASVDPLSIFPEAQAADELIPAGFTDEQALQMAMDFEQRGFDTYTRAAADAQGEAKAMWDYLAKVEDKHYAFLAETLEYLTTNGVWYFDEQELPFFEG